MKKHHLIAVCIFALASFTSSASAKTLLKFGSMSAVSGAYLGGAQIRGVAGALAPRTVKHAYGALYSSGRLYLVVTGLVLADDPKVPVEQRGKNDQRTFRAVVSCLSLNDNGGISEVNTMSEGFKANAQGSSFINTKLNIPANCVAPIVFVMSGSVDEWFAVTGS